MITVSLAENNAHVISTIVDDELTVTENFGETRSLDDIEWSGSVDELDVPGNNHRFSLKKGLHRIWRTFLRRPSQRDFSLSINPPSSVVKYKRSRKFSNYINASMGHVGFHSNHSIGLSTSTELTPIHYSGSQAQSFLAPPPR